MIDQESDLFRNTFTECAFILKFLHRTHLILWHQSSGIFSIHIPHADDTTVPAGHGQVWTFLKLQVEHKPLRDPMPAMAIMMRSDVTWISRLARLIRLIHIIRMKNMT